MADKVTLDTNLLVRYLTNDIPHKAKIVDDILSKAGNGELKIVMPSIVLAELVWVLESSYKMNEDEIVELVESILNTPGVNVGDKSIIYAALNRYKSKKIDFVDAWIVEFAKQTGVGAIYTFDKKHFNNVEDVNVNVL